MEGGSAPLWPATPTESEHWPGLVAVTKPDIVWKSSLQNLSCLCSVLFKSPELTNVVIDLVDGEDARLGCGWGGGDRVVFVPDVRGVGGDDGAAGGRVHHTADTEASCAVAVSRTSSSAALGPWEEIQTKCQSFPTYDVRQVPRMEDELAEVQTLFGNWTMLNSDITSVRGKLRL